MKILLLIVTAVAICFPLSSGLAKLICFIGSHF